MRKFILPIVFLTIFSTIVLISFQLGREEKFVIRVLDGDTILLEDGRKIRLMGIDAPEEGEYLYDEVREVLEDTIKGKKVGLECFGKDIYGRYLCYVFLGRNLINLELVKKGFAKVEKDYSHKFYKEFLQAEEGAKKNFLGIWKGSKFSPCIKVEVFHYNARGNDNENLNDEYFILKNICNFSVPMNGWKISDESGNFLIISVNLKPLSTLKVYSGNGKISIGMKKN